ncbi:formyltetrahydrofolate deformylase [Sphingobacterium spiritivorum]|uniref:Formyltetrahydrofolate deformylase n=1 Tax=Sphingobacterium spiritivorum ATCC 33861 TaxID=525373 RepID=D7VMV8_SPHSI|nr:formyltetrahydrofolate deformylase [Sphingobacterium spiritivorum]EFK57255.1 formyltetrahydrofolate deformylase [Sphingobacterium spiritivorum ATCC 33861]QQT36658.1 formyltetrahydrofolate deformylase [Sphingobacterium spiritivorum]WQD33410.1 formyltetrahydrofolate deformylase [Sphingobacterium spiritivorum]SUJ23240.1 Formyltetrahydrofolate deformylase [Sphingobacterium spiritivorum]
MTKPILILIQCQDDVGLVAKIANALAQYRLNIVTMREFVDEEAGKFFVRVVCTGKLENTEELFSALQQSLPDNASIKINPSERKKIIILVTKEHHCLADILIRHHFETWDTDIQAVIGNYSDLEGFTRKFDIPYHYVSHENLSKEEFEDRLTAQIDQYEFDYIILAKFMRILSPTFVQQYQGRIINIHHSFLPAFIGANPYRQAHTRGVKIIGATAHYVTDDLDEGPIIVQDTRRVNHTYTVQDMMTAGKEIEKAVLARAIRLLLEDRVMLDRNKTVVFE